MQTSTRLRLAIIPGTAALCILLTLPGFGQSRLRPNLAPANPIANQDYQLVFQDEFSYSSRADLLASPNLAAHSRP